MVRRVAHSLEDMLAGLSPVLGQRTFLFVTVPPGQEPPTGALEPAIGWFREEDGLSLILPLDEALSLGFKDGPPMRHIALQVRSALEGVGLTAAVAGRLAEHGIACNVVAAFHHDHLFVPADRADEAIRLLRDLQREVR